MPANPGAEKFEPGLVNVSDTALLVAIHRARESKRPKALFRDPWARVLAGERGKRIAREMAFGFGGWPVIARTVFFDQTIMRMVTIGQIGCVLNLAAGLDTRPYRLDLPDLPGILDDKRQRLAGASPRCRLVRVAGDLRESEARKRAVDATDGESTLVLTEGLLVYLAEGDVIALARDLAARTNVQYWLLDVSSPEAVRWGQRGRIGRQLASANASHRFAPAEGPEFFRPYGWAPAEVRSAWDDARQLNRLPRLLRLLGAITPRTRREAYASLIRMALLERQPTYVGATTGMMVEMSGPQTARPTFLPG